MFKNQSHYSGSRGQGVLITLRKFSTDLGHPRGKYLSTILCTLIGIRHWTLGHNGDSFGI